MATKAINHGRRKGSLRSTPDGKLGAQSPVRPGQVAVLTHQEWGRICGSLQRDKQQDGHGQSDREALHEKSKSIVKNWENTIEGQRLKKLQARKIREEKEEEERVKVDIEEAKYQAEKRREAIEKAKTLLYYQTDRVKQFHGALLLSEVLRERDSQVRYKQRREEALKNKDTRYVEIQAEQQEAAIRADLEAAQRRARERGAVANYQLEQASAKAVQRVEEQEAALREQGELDQEVAEFHQQQQEIEAQHRDKQLAYRKALDKVLEQKKEREMVERKKALEEEEEIKVFARAKKKMTEMRKAKEEEIFREFQTHQQRICDLLQAQQTQATSNEDQRIAQAIAEQDAKKEAEKAAKEEQFAAMSREIFAHMREQLAEQARAKQEQERMEQDLLKQRIIQDQKFHSQQLEKQRKRAKQAEDQQEFHRLQIKELSARKESTKKEDREFVRKNMELLKVEEDQFQQYSHNVISEAMARGATTQPLITAARPGAGGGHGRVYTGKGGMRPSYQATDSTAVELPCYGPNPTESKDTQKRMGFTW